MGGSASGNVGVLDFETDPFRAGRIPFPFAACIYFSQDDFFILWESDSRQDFVGRCIRLLRRMRPCVLYAHNGGRFDFHYLLEAATPGEVRIYNGRVLSFRIGAVTLKDSFPLMPFALEEYKKTKIDYAIFERGKRDKPRNRKRIESYLLDDCVYLHQLVTGFREIVGKKDTIGAAAFSQMKKLGIEIPRLSESHDNTFRPFYFGGRVQAFEKGIHNGPLLYVDINSAYPYAMLHHHPSGAEYVTKRGRVGRVFRGESFIHCIADSRGALPVRAEDGGIAFPEIREGEFFATGWEVNAGIETGTLKIREIIECFEPVNTICFKEYVETFFALRQRAKREGDAVKRLAYKYLLNAGYGKFATNPREFKEYMLAPFGQLVRGYDWENDFGSISLWSRSAYDGRGFYDVSTGASITGFVRAMLLRAIHSSSGVLYCDTDSILCRRTRVPLGDALGQWKIEGEGVPVKRAAIAGKKLWGIEWQRAIDGEKYRVASKGARLNWPELLEICNGNSIIWTNEAPTFSISGAHFITREISAT